MEKTFDEKIKEEIKLAKNNWNNRIEGAAPLNEIVIREIFATKHEINTERNEKGIPIPGTGRVITNEEKKMVFNYIMDNNYPLTKRVYNLVLNSYINGEIELEKNNSRKL